MDPTWERLVKFVSLRPRSQWEIKNWFTRKKTPEGKQDNYFERLKRLDLVGDKAFATWWINQRLEFRPKSKRELTSELIKKRVKKDLIKQTIEKAKINEVQIAKKILQKRKNQSFGKTAAYLMRRGFDWEVVKKVVKIDQEE